VDGDNDHGRKSDGEDSKDCGRPRRRPVARQLSSNPYLASSSSLEEHNHVTPAASFAFGENQEYEHPLLPLKSVSYPCAGEFVENLAHQQQYSLPNGTDSASSTLLHGSSAISQQQYYSNVINGNIQDCPYSPPPVPPWAAHPPCGSSQTSPLETTSLLETVSPTSTSSLPRSVNSWGHFSKNSNHNRYKYRRNDYSSESDEDVPSTPTQLPHNATTTSGGSPHPHTCLSEIQGATGGNVGNRKHGADGKHKDHNHLSEGVKPNVFKERFAVSIKVY
jgi:hypothetical protein